MALRATKYQRIVFEPGGIRIVPIGANGRVTCTTLPDTLAELREMASKLKAEPPFEVGAGDRYILENDCEVKYYLNKKLVLHLK